MIPAIRHEYVSACRKFAHFFAWAGVSGEDDTTPLGIDAVRQRLQPWLHVVWHRSGHPPLFLPNDLPGADVRHLYRRFRPWQDASTVDVDPPADRGAHARPPIACECPVSTNQLLGNLLCRERTEYLKGAFSPHALVPAAQEEARVVRIVIEMVVCEEEPPDLSRPQP